MKIHLRTLYTQDGYWSIEDERERLRDQLNELGFYVLHGIGDSLEVYAIPESSLWLA